MTGNQNVPSDQAVDDGKRFEVAIDRANALGIDEHFLCLAHDDPAWRRAVETALSSEKPMKKLLMGGSRPADLWAPGLLRTRMLQAIRRDPEVFTQLARLHPELAGRRNGDSPTLDEITRMNPFVAVLAAFLFHPLDFETQAREVERAADALEALRAQGALDPCAETAHEGQAASANDADSAMTRLSEIETQLRQRDQELKEAKTDLKQLRKELGQRKSEVSRKDRKAQELKTEKARLESERDDAVAALKQMREQRDELGRQNRRLQAQVDSAQNGQRTIETRRADETKVLQQANSDLREHLGATQELVGATQKRADALEAELDQERRRRIELEEVLDSLGFADLAASSATLQSALDVLKRFAEGAEAYLARQEEQERERQRLRDIGLAEQAAAEQARQAEKEAAAMWEARQRERLAEAEALLFPDGPIDHIIIDGHNLIHRVFRPEKEQATRPWLERMVGVMAERLEARGWTPCVHLTFDTKHASNMISGSHGVRMYFRNNTTEGGADAQIAELLREGNPQASYMVVSTDRKHVWSDTIEFIREEGAEVDLVQVELLAQYLQTLDEVA